MVRGRGRVAAAVLLVAALQVGAVGALVGGRWSGSSSALWGLPLDDGWIHLVYARGIALRGELAYNPGEPEVGATSPLWALALAPAGALPGHGAAVGAKVLGTLAALAACLLAAALARDLAGPVAGLVAGLVVALDPELAFSAASGMEVHLAATLGLGLLLALRRRRVVLAGALLGLAFLARPETAALGLVAVPWALSLARRGETTGCRLGLAALAAALLVAPLVLYCLQVAGRPLPNTFYAKSALAPLPLDGLRHLAFGVLPRSLVLGFGAGAALYLVGARDLIRRLGGDGIAVVAAGWALVLAVAASRAMPVEEVGTYYFARYLHPALPLLAVPLAAGAAALARWGRSPRRRTRARAVGVAAGLAGLATVATGLWTASERYSWSTRNIEEMQVAAGLWIAANTPEDAVIAASDAGAVRFFGGRRVVDLMGLNHAPSVEARRAGRIPLGEIMERERPDWLAVLPAWFPGIERGGRVVPRFEGRAVRYVVARAPQDRFVVYEVVRPAR